MRSGECRIWLILREFGESDGKPVPTQVERRAFDAHGRDVTGFLIRYHVPLNPTVLRRALGKDPIESLPGATLRALADAHLDNENWAVTTNYWWRQRFEPGRVVEIDQNYQPITGEFYHDASGETPQQAQDSPRRDLQEGAACADAHTRAALNAKVASKRYARPGTARPPILTSTRRNTC